MKNKKNWSISILIPFLLSVSIILVNLFEYSKLSKIQDNWLFYHSHIQKKQALVSKIKDSLGYGGFIHHFKNYVLRKTPRYQTLVLAEHENLNESYNKLFTLLNDEERVMLGSLSKVIDNYYNMLVLARDSIDSGMSSEEIDKLIRVDDRPAVAALSRIDKVLEADRLVVSRDIERLINETVRINFIYLILIVLFITVISFLIFKVFYRILDESRNLKRTKSRFLANVSHEIRTPLNGIVGFIELIDERELKENTVEYLNYIKSSSNLLVKMVNDILDYSKIENGELSIKSDNVKLENIILSNIDQFIPIAREKKVDINYSLKSDLPEFVVLDEKRLSQVLTNLISNSIKFIFEGDINVVVSKTFINELTYIQVQVIDTGPGMSKTVLEKAFKPFEQGDDSKAREYSGTGLGLSIVQSVVNLMKGHLEVQSEEGRGTTISFFIPLVEGEYLDEEIMSFEDFTPDISDKVLIAEDNKINQKVALNILKRVGYTEIVVAENGVEAVVKSDIHDFDIILMDIQMPKMDGIDATKEIRRISDLKNDDQPLIIGLSASVLQKDKAVAINHGMDDFIDKPLTIDKLKKSLVKVN